MKWPWPVWLHASSMSSQARTHWAASVIAQRPCGAGSCGSFASSRTLAVNIKHIAVSGPRWNTTVVVERRDTATLSGGAPYVNDGVHVVRTRRGKATSPHAYLDTEILALAFRKMAAEAVEAAAGLRQD